MVNTNLRRLDMGLLIIFSELMTYRKTTVVARKLALSQSAVSHGLARLRDIFGEELFLRSGTGLHPTGRALELAPEIADILAAASKMIDAGAAFQPGKTERTFRLAGNVNAATWLPAMLAGDFRQHAPHARFTFSTEAGDKIFSRLGDDDLDLGVVGLEPPPGFDHILLLEDEYIVIARPRHPKLKNGLDAETYLSLGHVNGGPDARLQGPTDEVMTGLGWKRRVVAGVSEFIAAATIVISSDLVVTMPARFARQYAPIFKYELYPLPFPAPRLKFHLVRHARTRNDSALNWLSQCILAHVQPAAAALLP